jgi:hypothetical protein
MKTNQKQLKLIKYGLKPSTVTKLNESQVESLYKRLIESNSETNEKVMVSGKNQAEIDKLKQTGSTFEVYEDMDAEMNWLMGDKETQDPIQAGPTGDGDPNSIQEKEMMEEFESKKQQKYFFAKCGDGKTKEQKKWCKMADEFASKTNFKKLPEKKKEETKEGGMSNLNKKIASAYAGVMKNKLNNMSENRTFGESEIEKQIMKLVEKHITPKMTKKEFLNLVKEQSPRTAPTTPGVKPGIDTPSKPSKPATPYKPKPGVKPSPKAKKQVPNWLSFNSIGIKLKK